MAGLTAPTIPDAPVPILSDNELRALLDVTQGRTFDQRRDHAIFRVLIDIGIRVGELVKINLEDLDLQRCEIRVIGKGDRSRFVPIGVKAVEDLDWAIAGALTADRVPTARGASGTHPP